MYITRISPGYYICRVGGRRVALLRHAKVWRVSPVTLLSQRISPSPDLSSWEAYHTLAAAKARAEGIFDGLAR